MNLLKPIPRMAAVRKSWAIEALELIKDTLNGEIYPDNREMMLLQWNDLIKSHILNIPYPPTSQMIQSAIESRVSYDRRMTEIA